MVNKDIYWISTFTLCNNFVLIIEYRTFRRTFGCMCSFVLLVLLLTAFVVNKVLNKQMTCNMCNLPFALNLFTLLNTMTCVYMSVRLRECLCVCVCVCVCV